MADILHATFLNALLYFTVIENNVRKCDFILKEKNAQLTKG